MQTQTELNPARPSVPSAALAFFVLAEILPRSDKYDFLRYFSKDSR